jgi:hypothetical protein
MHDLISRVSWRLIRKFQFVIRVDEEASEGHDLIPSSSPPRTCVYNSPEAGFYRRGA